ncbi:hypothetical protein LCGC14_2831580, partial [marine sediment metagenome]
FNVCLYPTIMRIEKKSVLLVLEGTYPFNGGGVSTWAHILCNRVSTIDYKLYSINSDFEDNPDMN